MDCENELKVICDDDDEEQTCDNEVEIDVNENRWVISILLFEAKGKQATTEEKQTKRRVQLPMYVHLLRVEL
eukprot:CAMPEP_0171022862 /NCGR_PEP_ID=MMETSP0736-20130129/31742_1 /TAXON_ID=186038 /ORGANISM="Fragilariopsis kerguelensis, Strain L26-C5" /LENGTH=71 /DNA_ID=CAMNT_0011461893 /DNA_START=15 /DNA_END=227 /DNA_ORIENTATION=-